MTPFPGVRITLGLGSSGGFGFGFGFRTSPAPGEEGLSSDLSASVGASRLLVALLDNSFGDFFTSTEGGGDDGGEEEGSSVKSKSNYLQMDKHEPVVGK